MTRSELFLGSTSANLRAYLGGVRLGWRRTMPHYKEMVTPGRIAGAIPTGVTGSTASNLRGSILKTILVVAAGLLACAGVPGRALAQHAGGHAGGGHVGGGMRGGAPPHGAIVAPRVGGGVRGAGPRGIGVRGAGLAGLGPRGFRFRPRGINVFHHRLFFGAPFFRFGVGLGFNSLWWPNCGPSFAWGWGFNCSPAPFYGYGFENYVAVPTYESPAYLYGEEGRDLIWLYLKDGTVYGVSDYWLVDGQIHYSMFEDEAAGPAEHTFPYDELDVRKTIDVNTRRGFRIVFRDEPWQQYLKDHPDLTPTDVPPPQTHRD